MRTSILVEKTSGTQVAGSRKIVVRTTQGLKKSSFEASVLRTMIFDDFFSPGVVRTTIFFEPNQARSVRITIFVERNSFSAAFSLSAV